MPRYNSRTGTGHRRGLTKTQAAWLCAAVVVLAIIVAAWLYHSRPSGKRVATIPSTTSTGSPAANQSSGQSQSSGSNNPAPSSGTQPNPTPAPALPLTAPWGDFVSNHYPGQNGTPTAETSTCNTTPGATCYIRFTNGAQTRTLAAKVADDRGAVIWNWDVKTAGFATGNWKVSAVATLDGQTKTANDDLALVVK